MKFAVFTLASAVGLFGGVHFFKTTETKADLVEVASTSGPIKVTSVAPPSHKQVQRLTVNKDRVVYLDEEVDFQSVTTVINKLKELNSKSAEPIYLLLDSPGGSVLDGGLVISEMESSKAPVNTVCTRICASMAAMIHSYGKRRYSLDRSILMYHPASGQAQGQIPNMMSQLNSINKYTDRMFANISDRSMVSKEELARRVAYEIWEEAEDAVNEGFSDQIISLNVPSFEPPQARIALPGQEKKTTKKTNVTEFKWIAPDSQLYLWNR